jgi:hypothetical protein
MLDHEHEHVVNKMGDTITEQAARIAALEAEKQELIAALTRISMTCNAELSDVENTPTYQLAEPYGVFRQIEADADAVLAKVTK